MSAPVREDYRLVLRARTPVHVGADGANGIADLPMATDGLGRLIIPGTSWAGVLRAVMRTIAPAQENTVFGHADGEEGRASRLSVFDTVVDDGGDLALRTGVGIDRRTGAAADRLLYDRIVIPPGHRFTLDLRYDGPPSPALAALVAHVRATGLTIGAAGSRGLGRLDCQSATVRRTDLHSRAAVLALLAGDTAAEDITPTPAAATGLGIRIAWRPREPVLVGAAAEGTTAHLVPLTTTGADGGLVPVLPGSSIKGMLRSEAERAVRTLTGPDSDPGDDPAAAADALAARVPALAVLFGTRERAGALRIPDVAATPEAGVPAAQWARQFTDTAPPNPPWARPRTRVAIDRWTGGAADARLFTTLEPRIWSWEPISLDLDEARIPDQQRTAALVLLGVAAAPLVEGTARIGYATTRGSGGIEPLEVTVTGIPGHTGDWWAWLRHLADGTPLDTLLGIGDLS
ncbi:RAMP superfamily CRISPR-associated protein [Actinosynnema sp. NPDC059797]